jgi:glycosyltransferase involved in cell wall biosynthesis
MDNNHSKEKSPKISVVIPCYNHAHYLPFAVQSVLQQTLQDFEIIIVNDGSTDMTSDISQKIIEDNPRFSIKLINQANSGLASTRNSGIAKSIGQYILPLDADDTIAPTMLRECAEILDHQKSISIVYTDRKDFGESEKIVLAGDFKIRYVKYFNQISYCSMYRKEIWVEIGGYRTNMKPSGEDWDFWVAAASRNLIGYHIRKPLFNYRRRNDGLFQEVQRNHEKVFAQIILNNQDVYEKNEIKDAENAVLGNNNTLLVNIAARFFYQVKDIESCKLWKLRNILKTIKKTLKFKKINSQI